MQDLHGFNTCLPPPRSRSCWSACRSPSERAQSKRADFVRGWAFCYRSALCTGGLLAAAGGGGGALVQGERHGAAAPIDLTSRCGVPSSAFVGVGEQKAPLREEPSFNAGSVDESRTCHTTSGNCSSRRPDITSWFWAPSTPPSFLLTSLIHTSAGAQRGGSAPRVSYTTLLLEHRGEGALAHLTRGADGAAEGGIQQPQALVHCAGGMLAHPQRVNDLERHQLAANLEVFL